MKPSWGLGPVFAFECMTATRRWRLYAGRVLFVLILMIGLSIIWAPSGQTFRADEMADLAARFLLAVVSIQLAVVALAAPAVTAGALCVDKSRGTLHHAFVTDLTAGEIVVGKLASRLVSILALMACGLPVLALSSLLGGIDLLAALGAYLVTFGVAVVGCGLALTFSVWARKPHQALLPTYAVLGVWAGALPILIDSLRMGPPPTWSSSIWVAFLTTPIFCTFAPLLDPSANMLAAQAGFLAVAVLFTTALVLVATRYLRPVALGQASRPARRDRPGFAARLVALLPEPPLDGNPVLWREWHRKRPSRWTGRLWTVYAGISGLASLAVIAQYYVVGAGLYGGSGPAGLVNGWEVAIGLLLLSISAPLALSEERDRGSLDIIMATPLSARTILWGKWWGTFAIVPRLAILPIWVTTALALVSGRWIGLLIMIGMIFAPAAAITSIGLALAARIARTERAVTVSILAYVLMTLGWSVILQLLPRNYSPYGWGLYWQTLNWEGLSLGNPFVGVVWATEDAGRLTVWYIRSSFAPGWALLAIACHLAVATIAMLTTVRSFDRCLGRVSEHGSPGLNQRGLSPKGSFDAPPASRARRTDAS